MKIPIFHKMLISIPGMKRFWKEQITGGCVRVDVAPVDNPSFGMITTNILQDAFLQHSTQIDNY